MPAPVDPDRARLNALRHDVAAAGRGEAHLTPAGLQLAEREIARLERVVGEAR